MSALVGHRLRYMRWDGPTTARVAVLEKEVVEARRLKGHLAELHEELMAAPRKRGLARCRDVRQFAAEVEFMIWSFDCAAWLDLVKPPKQGKPT